MKVILTCFESSFKKCIVALFLFFLHFSRNDLNFAILATVWKSDYLSDCLPFIGFFDIVILGRRTFKRCMFSFPLSYSLSDVRSVSLFAFRTTDCTEELAQEPPATGAWDKQNVLVQK